MLFVFKALDNSLTPSSPIMFDSILHIHFIKAMKQYMIIICYCSSAKLTSHAECSFPVAPAFLQDESLHLHPTGCELGCA